MLTSGSIFLAAENGESGDEDEDAERKGMGLNPRVDLIFYGIRPSVELEMLMQQRERERGRRRTRDGNKILTYLQLVKFIHLKFKWWLK